MSAKKTMQELSLGESGWVENIDASGAMHGRLMNLGLMKGNKVTCLFASALKDPRAYGVCGGVIALRDVDAGLVRVVSEESN